MIISLSDIHTGELDAERLLNELELTVLEPILRDEYPDLDAVMICGDSFHKRLHADTAHVETFLIFTAKLLQLAKIKKFVVRNIQGTRSHDLNTVKVLSWAFMFDENYKYVPAFSFENIISPKTGDVIKVAYVPEEYPADFNEYYIPRFEEQLQSNGKLHYIFGHGSIAFAVHGQQISEAEFVVASAPIFPDDFFDKYVGGYVIFGHIHTTCHKGLAHYNGSFTMLCHGEGPDKGMLVSSVSSDMATKSIKFVKNEYAPVYKTFQLSNVIEKIKSSEKYQTATENQQWVMAFSIINKQFEKFAKIRLVVDIAISPFALRILRELFGTNENFKELIKVPVQTIANSSNGITEQGKLLGEADEDGNMELDFDVNTDIEIHPVIKKILTKPDDVVGNILDFSKMVSPDSNLDHSFINGFMSNSKI